MNTKKLKTTKAQATLLSGFIGTPTSKIQVENLAAEIVAAFGGDAVGNALILSAVRGGVDMGLLKMYALQGAYNTASRIRDSGYLLKGGKLDIRTGKGKTLANALSLAATASLIEPPLLGESLSGWHKRVTFVAPIESPLTIVPTSGQSEPEKPLPLVKPLEQTKAEDKAEVLAFNSETPEVSHSAPLPKADGTAKTVDNVKELVALIDDTLGDAELTALIFELQKLRVDRTMKIAV
jgi:hypothetical protein